MEMNFCRRCGHKLVQKDPGVYTCESGHTLFSNAAPTTNVFFVNDKKEVMLSIRANEPFKGSLSACGGFIEINESAEAALERELLEELGLKPDQYETPQFLCTSTNIYPFDGETNRTVLGLLFWSKLKPDAKPIPNDDVADIVWVPLENVDFGDIESTDIRTGLKKLQQLFLLNQMVL